MPFYEAEGEAAFYGPKLDVQIRTALGKEETLSTVQLDIVRTEHFCKREMAMIQKVKQWKKNVWTIEVL